MTHFITAYGLIFDVDGTLAETEEVHREAFNAAFDEFGLDWAWDRERYRVLLRTTGGRERILVHAGEVGDQVDAAAIHARKTELYNERILAGEVALRPGVEDLLHAARRAGVPLAIATTTSRPNVTSLLTSTLGQVAVGWFSSIRTGEDVAVKKPDPEVYRLAITDIGLDPDVCLAFEDSANGLIAAKAAGLATIVTPGIYTDTDRFDGADLIVADLTALALSVGHGCLTFQA